MVKPIRLYVDLAARAMVIKEAMSGPADSMADGRGGSFDPPPSMEL